MAKHSNAKVDKLTARLLEALEEKLESTRAVVSDLERRIAAIKGEPLAGERRKRTPPDRVRKLIDGALAKAPKGLTQTEIRKATDLPYGTVVQYFRRNKKEYEIVGKRYFLK